MTLILDEMRMRMAVHFVNAKWQKRPVLMSDDKLMNCAQYRASHMAEKNYFDHVSPGGTWANEWVRQFDYSLPFSYLFAANNVESIGKGFSTPEGFVEALFISPDHRPHVTGNVPFFYEHTNFGVGYKVNVNGVPYYVLITCPPEPKKHNIYIPVVSKNKQPEAT